MARVLYIWEFGGGLGHLTTALPLAQAYRVRGHDIAFVVPDVVAAAAVIPADYRVYQAPIWHTRADNPTVRPISYAEILLGKGFDNPARLAAMVRSWIELLRALAPDVLVLDFSPTAMLAAQILGLRHCTIGHGFFLPPRSVPVPGFAARADATRLMHSEDALLAAINQVRAAHRAEPLPHFADFFAADLDLLTTWPELEHYPQRSGARYWGPVLLRTAANPPQWQRTDRARLFVYLYASHPKLETMLQALEESGVEAWVYVPGISEDVARSFAGERLRFSRKMHAMDKMLADVDAVVCHGNFGTLWEAMLAGRPALCLPVHVEQDIATKALVERGAAIALPADVSAELAKREIHDVLQQPAYRQAAGQIARQYSGYDSRGQLARMVESSLGENA